MNAVAGKRVVVAMSGGVDSSVVAAMMLEHGASVVGVTFRFFDSESTEIAVTDANRVANQLGIEHHIIDCVDVFKKNVLDYFENSYKHGKTPSPCLMCNNMVKFKTLYDGMLMYNADMVATGHYARLSVNAGKISLKSATDRSRDQSYFLYRVPREVMLKTVFPLGNVATKATTRSLAAEYGIHVAEKGDSQDVCFMNTAWYREFINSGRTGVIEDEIGDKVGIHKGVIHYTLGQRKGLGLSGGPYFVKSIDACCNRLVVSRERPVVNDVLLDDMVFINDEPVHGECFAKIRSQGDMARCHVNGNVVHLVEADCAAPGQHCVLYNEQHEVLGGGIIALHK